MQARILLPVLLLAYLTACQALEAPATAAAPTFPVASGASPAPATAETPASLPETGPDASPTAAPAGDAKAFPDPGAYKWGEMASGLERPVDLQDPGDGSGRLFLVEKAGRIRIYENGTLLTAPFLDISGRVGSGGNEQGLLGLAFHPRYAETGLFFVNYTDRAGNTVIARFQVSSEANVALADSEVALLRVEQPYPNHNGGVLAFGPDGHLYAGLGDGGAAGDPFGNAQSLDTLLGKILRLDVDGGEPYAIPGDNPFGDEIWAYGLRNPWRMSFDRLTGDLYIGDVGQNQWEEIDFLPAGASGDLNFGWDLFEGSHAYEGAPPQNAQFIPPVAEYDHSQGCSVTGGHVYRGALPAWQGIYLYGDYCSGTIWGLLRSGDGWSSQPLFATGATITSFGQDQSGELYLLSDSGRVMKLGPR